MQMPFSPVKSAVVAEAKFSPGDCLQCINDALELSSEFPLLHIGLSELLTESWLCLSRC